ncbi:hypothetical protein CAPTEDRAFT_49438, partial [Capitella teleta]
GQDYIGELSVTIDGVICQRWDAPTPHSHRSRVDQFLLGTMTDDANFCRNPWGEPDGPMCYAMNPGQRWQYCDIAFC